MINKIYIYMIYFSIGCMAVLDTINGFFLNQGTEIYLGQLIRFTFLAVLILYLFANFTNKIELIVIISYFVSLIYYVFLFLFNSNIKDLIFDISEISKIYLILFLILTMRIRFRIDFENTKKMYTNLLAMNSYLFPLMLIIPKILNLGEAVYSNGAGYKGLFYANNDLSIILIALFWINIIILTKNYKNENEGYFIKPISKIDTLVRLFLILISCYLIGAKSVYAFAFAAIVYFVLVNIFKLKILTLTKYLSVFVVIVLLLISYFKELIISSLNLFIERQSYFFMTRVDEGSIYSLFVFLTTDRLLFVKDVLNSFYLNTLNNPLDIMMPIIGLGKSHYLNNYRLTEMDAVDFIFSYGLILFLIFWIVVFIDFKKFLSIDNKYSVKKPVILIISIITFFSFTGGHVIFSAMAGSIFGLTAALVGVNNDKLNESKGE